MVFLCRLTLSRALRGLVRCVALMQRCRRGCLAGWQFASGVHVGPSVCQTAWRFAHCFRLVSAVETHGCHAVLVALAPLPVGFGPLPPRVRTCGDASFARRQCRHGLILTNILHKLGDGIIRRHELGPWSCHGSTTNTRQSGRDNRGYEKARKRNNICQST